MSDNMVLIMVDECGDEVEVGRFTIGNELDEDYIDMWKDMKISKAREEYPEAQRFYFEDRRNWHSMINQMIREDERYYEDDEEEWEDDSDIGCEDCPDDECTGHCMSCSYRSV